MGQWPFEHSEDTPAFCRASIFNAGSSIIRVCRNSADQWMFLDGYIEEGEEPHIVCFSHVLEFDPSIAELADLQLGWCAEREGPGESWVRSRLTEAEDE